VNTKHHDNDLGHDNNHDNNDDNEQLEDRGRGLGLRLLALLGAVSFLMLGISSIAPLLQPASPPQLPDQRRSPVSFRH
jgi:hypothetical protein